ncbi:hypothetical protein [Kitasatospora paranensis]|uniref:hypothetical protein n=1 Tax=Kitasatospora paranensis TaxID=258053 RepID=UPI0031EFD79D
MGEHVMHLRRDRGTLGDACSVLAQFPLDPQVLDLCAHRQHEATPVAHPQSSHNGQQQEHAGSVLLGPP